MKERKKEIFLHEKLFELIIGGNVKCGMALFPFQFARRNELKG